MDMDTKRNCRFFFFCLFFFFFFFLGGSDVLFVGLNGLLVFLEGCHRLIRASRAEPPWSFTSSSYREFRMGDTLGGRRMGKIRLLGLPMLGIYF